MKRISRSLLMVALALPALGPGVAQAQEPCPGKPNAHVVSRTESRSADGTIRRTTRCECNQGYESQGGACVLATSIGPRKEPIIRAQTRAECVREAGVQLKQDLAKCESPVVECLKTAGVRPREAICAASALVVAADPSKVTVLGAMIACGDSFYQAADICAPTWGSCQNGPLASHKAAVASCPEK